MLKIILADVECYEAWEFHLALCNRKAGNFGCVTVGLRVSLVCHCALACPFQIWGKHAIRWSNPSRQGFQRSWERLRLATEQGKQLALNRERIASLYSCKGNRLVLSVAQSGVVAFCFIRQFNSTALVYSFILTS